jgi:hypothetical protein
MKPKLTVISVARSLPEHRKRSWGSSLRTTQTSPGTHPTASSPSKIWRVRFTLHNLRFQDPTTPNTQYLKCVHFYFISISLTFLQSTKKWRRCERKLNPKPDLHTRRWTAPPDAYRARQSLQKCGKVSSNRLRHFDPYSNIWEFLPLRWHFSVQFSPLSFVIRRSKSNPAVVLGIF